MSLLACVLTASVTPTYVLLLCSAAQCNKRHHNYEQALIASQQSESSQCSSSAADSTKGESSEAEKVEKVEVDQLDQAVNREQARGQEVCDWDDLSSLGNSLDNDVSSMEERKTDYTVQADDSPNQVPRVGSDQVDITVGKKQKITEELKATLVLLSELDEKKSPMTLVRSIPSIEETDCTPQEDSPKVPQVEVSNVGVTLEKKRENLERKHEKIRLLEAAATLKTSISPSPSLEETDCTTKGDSQGEVGKMGITVEQKQKITEELKAISMLLREHEAKLLIESASVRLKNCVRVDEENEDLDNDKDFLKSYSEWSIRTGNQEDVRINNCIRKISANAKID